MEENLKEEQGEGIAGTTVLGALIFNQGDRRAAETMGIASIVFKVSTFVS